jgi:hypothetical protein
MNLEKLNKPLENSRPNLERALRERELVKIENFLKNYESVLYDLVYLLHNYLEPMIEPKKQKIIEDAIANFAEIKEITKIEPNIKFSNDIPNMDELADYCSQISQEYINSNLHNNFFIKHYSKFYKNITLYKTLNSFNIHEQFLALKSKNQISIFDLLQLTSNFGFLGYLITKKNEEMFAPLNNESIFEKGYIHNLLNSMPKIFYKISTKSTLKIINNLTEKHYTDKLVSRIKLSEEQVSYSINDDLFNFLIKKHKSEFSAKELEILACVKNGKLQDGITAFIVDTKADTDLLPVIDELFHLLYKNIWVKLKCEELQAEYGKFTQHKDRKKLQKLKKEGYDYYNDTFYELETPWKKTEIQTQEIMDNTAHEVEEFKYEPEISHNIDANDVGNQETTILNQLSSFISTEQLNTMKNKVPEHMLYKINKVLTFAWENQIQISQNLSILTHKMKYGGSLPWIKNQLKQMKINGKLIPQALKLNVTKGDRLLIFFDNNQNINIFFMTAQDYHNQRKL